VSFSSAAGNWGGGAGPAAGSAAEIVPEPPPPTAAVMAMSAHERNSSCGPQPTRPSPSGHTPQLFPRSKNNICFQNYTYINCHAGYSSVFRYLLKPYYTYSRKKFIKKISFLRKMCNCKLKISSNNLGNKYL
jgi:hypothetical protein